MVSDLTESRWCMNDLTQGLAECGNRIAVPYDLASWWRVQSLRIAHEK